MSSSENVFEAIQNLDESAALHHVDRMIESGVGPVQVLEECRRGMTAIGERFERGEVFLSGLIMAAEIFTQVTERVKPYLEKTTGSAKGIVVIGTVEGDVHDIGKNICNALLEADGFEVVDLGVDVPPAKFVEAIRDHSPDIVGMSSLLSTSIEAVKRTVDSINEAGLRGRVKVIVGGGRMDKQAAEYIGADAYTDNASQGVKLCWDLLEGV